MPAFIRVPPDSTGKRSLQIAHLHLSFTGGTIAFKVGETVTTPSGIAGVINKVNGTVATGELHVQLLSTSAEATIDGEAIQIGGITHAFASGSGTAFYTQAVVLVGANDNHVGQRINPRGSASVRFTEGEPQFGAAGLIRLASPARLADYTFPYNARADLIQSKLLVGATATYLPTESSVAIDVTSAAGSAASLTSHRYHRFTPGSAMYIPMSCACGDSGKVNLTRRWGYYDDNDGLFFEQTDSIMYVAVRSSISGSPVDTKVPITAWNTDNVDGTNGPHNLSGMLLDTTKQNVYWIDFQYDGAGVARFGTFTPSGERIVMHTIENANLNLGPYMATATLPIRAEIINNGITASPSRLKFHSAAVFLEGTRSQDSELNHSVLRSWTTPASTTVGDTETLIAHFRAGLTLDGKPNRKRTIPRTLHYHVSGAPVQIIIRAGGVITGATWTNATIAGSAAQYSDGAGSTVQFAGVQVGQGFYPLGPSKEEVSDSFNSLGANLHINADGTPGTFYSVYAKSLVPGTPAVVWGGLDWVDV